MLSVSKWTIYRWIDEGRLRGTKIGRGSLRVFRTSVEELIEKIGIEGPEVSKSAGPRTDRGRNSGQKQPKKR